MRMAAAYVFVVGETGEAIARIETREGSSAVRRLCEPEDSEKKILRDVFEPGDAWMRSGDLMRKHGRGFYYFSDRIGDSFRWKGENVSTFEVAQVLAACPGVRDVNVYGVAVPGFEGRAGMAALVMSEDFDIARLRREHRRGSAFLCPPLVLRLCEEPETTETFKHKAQALAAQGFDPEKTRTPIFAWPGSNGFIPLDPAIRPRILAGEFRL